MFRQLLVRNQIFLRSIGVRTYSSASKSGVHPEIASVQNGTESHETPVKESTPLPSLNDEVLSAAPVTHRVSLDPPKIEIPKFVETENVQTSAINENVEVHHRMLQIPQFISSVETATMEEVFMVS